MHFPCPNASSSSNTDSIIPRVGVNCSRWPYSKSQQVFVCVCVYTRACVYVCVLLHACVRVSRTVNAGVMVLSSMSDKATTPYELLIQHTLWTVDTGGIEVPPEYELLRVGLPDLMAAGLRFKGLVEDSCHVPTNGVLGGCQGECHPPGVA